MTYAEVEYKLLKRDRVGAWEQAADVLKSLPIEIH
jgi:hypothetical protein